MNIRDAEETDFVLVGWYRRIREERVGMKRALNECKEKE